MITGSGKRSKPIAWAFQQISVARNTLNTTSLNVDHDITLQGELSYGTVAFSGAGRILVSPASALSLEACTFTGQAVFLGTGSPRTDPGGKGVGNCSAAESGRAIQAQGVGGTSASFQSASPFQKPDIFRFRHLPESIPPPPGNRLRPASRSSEAVLSLLDRARSDSGW